MNLEAGKELDRQCVMKWLNEMYVSPSCSYNEYTDDEIQVLAKDALVLLKEYGELKERHKFLVNKCDELYSILKDRSNIVRSYKKESRCKQCGICSQEER